MSAAKSEKKVRKSYNVTWEVFLTTWQDPTVKSVQEVATRLSMPKGTVIARAAAYRKKGATLREMPRQRVDVTEMNAFIEKLNGGSSES